MVTRRKNKPKKLVGLLFLFLLSCSNDLASLSFTPFACQPLHARAVVSTGPVRATATFANKEEVDLVPIYRDPVHDFGFFTFNPAAVKHMRLTAIELAPNAARVGLEIRVVGNDAGNKRWFETAWTRFNRWAGAHWPKG